MRIIKILLVGHRELIYRRVRGILEREADMGVVGICSSADEALSQIVRLRPDIILTDTQLTDMNWIEATDGLKKGRTDSGFDVIILAESFDDKTEVLKTGATICLLEDKVHEELIPAVRNTYRNRHLLNEHVIPIALEEMTEVVVPPSASSAQLLKFMCQLAEQQQGDFASIVCATGSWDRGATITIRSQPSNASNLLAQLAEMPGVNKVEEQLPSEGALSGFTNKLEFLSRLGIHSNKRLYVTLDETNR